MEARVKQLLLRSIDAYNKATPAEQNNMFEHVEKLVNKGTWHSTYESYYFKAGSIFVRMYRSKH